MEQEQQVLTVTVLKSGRIIVIESGGMRAVNCFWTKLAVRKMAINGRAVRFEFVIRAL